MMLAATDEGIDSIWIGLFDPDIIKQKYISSYKEIFTNAANKSYFLKREYFRPPIFDLRRKNVSDYGNWNFKNF
jgi:hypothetical protein